MNFRHFALIGFVGCAGAAVAGTGEAQTTQPAQVAQGAAGNGPVTPVAVPTSAPRNRGRGASPEPTASETPEPPQFTSMDGVWEVASQPLDSSLRVTYSHLFITQHGDQLTGRWVRGGTPKEKKTDTYVFSGTFDGRLFKLSLKNNQDVVYTMSGYAENFSDMVGLLTSADPKDKGLPFTASHRKNQKFMLSSLPNVAGSEKST